MKRSSKLLLQPENVKSYIFPLSVIITVLILAYACFSFIPFSSWTPRGCVPSESLHDLRSDVIAAFSGTVTFLTLGAAIIAGNYAKRQVDVLTSQHENEKGNSSARLAVVNVMSISLNTNSKYPSATIQLKIHNLGKNVATYPQIILELGGYKSQPEDIPWIVPSPLDIKQEVTVVFKNPATFTPEYEHFRIKYFAGEALHAIENIAKINPSTPLTVYCDYTTPGLLSTFRSSSTYNSNGVRWSTTIHKVLN